MRRGNKGLPNLRTRTGLYGGEPAIITDHHPARPQWADASWAPPSAPKKMSRTVAHYGAEPVRFHPESRQVVLASKFGAACMGLSWRRMRRQTRCWVRQNLDKVWLYGGSADTIMENRTQGTQPANHAGLQRVPRRSGARAVGVLVWSLSNPQTSVKDVMGTSSHQDVCGPRADLPREAKIAATSWRWYEYGLPARVLRLAVVDLEWQASPAVRLDTRKFYIFGVVLWPQDFIYTGGLLSSMCVFVVPVTGHCRAWV